MNRRLWLGLAAAIACAQPEADAERETDLPGPLACTRPDGAKVLWNKVYGGRNPIFGEPDLDFRIVRFEDTDAFGDWNPGEKHRLERLAPEKPLE